MKSLAIFVCILIASTTAVKIMGPTRNIMEVFAQVQEQMKSGGPMDAIINMLDKMRSDIKAEQGNHDEVNKNNLNECTTEHDFRTAEVADAVESINAATATKNQCAQALANAEANLVQNQKELGETRAELKNAIETRRDQNTLYVQRTQEHADAIQAVKEAYGMLDEIMVEDNGAASFAQLSSMSGKMLRSAIKLGATHHYAPVIAVLAQIANKKVQADSEALDKIRALFQKLEKNLDQSQANYDSQEAKEKAAFEANKARLEGEIEQLLKEAVQLRSTIAKMQVCVANQQAIIEEASAKRDRNQKLLNDSQNMCDNFMAEYNVSNGKREQELQLVSEIKALVMKRYNQISDQITSRGYKNADQWAEYTNATPIPVIKPYKYTQAKYNKEGAEGANFDRKQHLEKL